MTFLEAIQNMFRKPVQGIATDTDDRQFLKNRHSCPACKEHIEETSLIRNLYVCPFCHYHFRLTGSERIQLLCDAGTYRKDLFSQITSKNPINFPGYEEKLAQAAEKSGLNEAVVIGSGKIGNHSLAIIAMSFQFMGGSMGSAVGEKITRGLLWAMEEKLPCLICTASGGARMQEGTYSLMQLAKTSHAVAIYKKSQLPLFVLLTDPTTGGVTASFSMLGDVTLAEPRALIGFAGPRVIEGTIKQKLPHDFQRAEFLQKKGFVDMVVSRLHLRNKLLFLLDSHMARTKRTSKSGEGLR